MYFFTTADLDLQQDDQAYGPLDNHQVRLTSRHSGQNLPAYAVTQGQLLALAVGDNHLNLILKPLSVVQHHDLPIRYFLYRNVKRDSIVAADDTILKDPASDFLTSIHTAHTRRREQIEEIGGPPLPENPSASVLGIGPIEQLPSETTIDSLFIDSPNGVTPIMVEASWQLGHFGDEFAFSVVLDSLFYPAKLADCSPLEHIVQLSESAPLSERVQQAQKLLRFLDPAAFYADAGEVRLQDGPTAALANVRPYFSRKNRVILDIRDGDGLPLLPGTTLNIDLGGGWQPITMGDYPFIEFSGDAFLAPTADGYLLKVALPIAEKTDPILFISGGTTPDSFPDRLTGNDQFQALDGSDGQFSSELTFIIPKGADGSSSATHIRLYYRDGSNALDPAAFAQNRFDKLPLVPLPPDGEMRIYQAARILDEAAFGGSALLAAGIVNDLENVILFTFPSLSSRQRADITPQLMSTHKTSASFTQEISRFDSKPTFVPLVVQGEAAVVLTPAPETTPFSRPERWDDFKSLLLTRSEYDQLRTLAASHFISALPTYLGLEWHSEDVETGLTSYQIELIGFVEDTDGLRQARQDTDIEVRIAK